MKIKKLMVAVLSFIMVIAASGAAYAEDIYVGSSKYTNTVTYINHYPIPSYNFEGETYICVELLEYYGFDLVWNEYEKTKCIIRNNENYIFSVYTFLPRKDQIGEDEYDFYECGVKVYLGDHEKEVQCFKNIEGYLFIKASELGYFGKVDWVPEVNALKIWIEDGLEMRDTMYPLRENPHPFKYRKYIVSSDKVSFSEYLYIHGIDIAFAFRDYEKRYEVIPSGNITITVLDSYGNVIGNKTEYFSESDFDEYPYFYYMLDAPAAVMVYMPYSDLKPTHDGKALIKYKINVESNVYEFERYIEGLPTV